ncbi:unnamed protein product [Mycena citricolor]|uniref:GATA-type domain-containing protein n=1 Tax=Mycena citricolor TaxID=2018698 RepID=A0AAD2K3E9_9AGAR|nr:unnamed protein product [Mycena citricolor]
MPSILNLKFKGNKSFVAFSNLNDAESLTKTWKVCTKVASYLEQGQRLENLAWRLWHLQNLMVDTDNAKSKREFRKLSKVMGDKLDREKGRAIESLPTPDLNKHSLSSDLLRQRAEEKERSREAAQLQTGGGLHRMQFTFAVEVPADESSSPSAQTGNQAGQIGSFDAKVSPGAEQSPNLNLNKRKRSAAPEPVAPGTVRLPTVFSTSFGPSALLAAPANQLSSAPRKNYGDTISSGGNGDLKIARPTVELQLDELLHADSEDMEMDHLDSQDESTHGRQEWAGWDEIMQNTGAFEFGTKSFSSTPAIHPSSTPTPPFPTFDFMSMGPMVGPNDPGYHAQAFLGYGIGPGPGLLSLDTHTADSSPHTLDPGAMFSSSSHSNVVTPTGSGPNFNGGGEDDGHDETQRMPVRHEAKFINHGPEDHGHGHGHGRATPKIGQSVFSISGGKKGARVQVDSDAEDDARLDDDSEDDGNGGDDSADEDFQFRNAMAASSASAGRGRKAPATGRGGKKVTVARKKSSVALRVDTSANVSASASVGRRPVLSVRVPGGRGTSASVSTEAPSSSFALPSASGAGSGGALPGEKAECSNCGATRTPLWRRGLNDELNCNACGLYCKLHKRPRPKTMRSAGTSEGRGQSARSEVVDVVAQCYNCHTTATPLWRKDDEGKTVCNACGLYYKLHGSARPISMKNDVIRKRSRHDARRGSMSNGLAGEGSRITPPGETSNSSGRASPTLAPDSSTTPGTTKYESVSPELPRRATYRGALPFQYHHDAFADALPFASVDVSADLTLARANKRRRMSIDSASEPPSSAFSGNSFGGDGYTSASSQFSMEFPFAQYPNVYSESSASNNNNNGGPFWHPPMVLSHQDSIGGAGSPRLHATRDTHHLHPPMLLPTPELEEDTMDWLHPPMLPPSFSDSDHHFFGGLHPPMMYDGGDTMHF